MAFHRATFRFGAIVCAGIALTALVGCQGSTNDVLALGEHAPIPRDALEIMRARGMTPSSPIMIRIFKEEAILEVWKQNDTGRFELVKSYEICAYSGKPGPKFKEGDRQAPEGFYLVGRPQMNPRSSYHLAFNLGFPNAYDRSHGRTGTHLMVHGDCSSAGCYAMTDEGVAEIYAFARDALQGGRQDKFQVQAFPFRMTPENMALHADHEHFEYWSMIKQGYDHFELTKVPPKVDVCEKRYVFNMESEGQFSASAPCPDMSMPPSLLQAYQAMQAEHQVRFEAKRAEIMAKAAQEAAAAAPVAPEDVPVSVVAPAAPDVVAADGAGVAASVVTADNAPFPIDRP